MKSDITIRNYIWSFPLIAGVLTIIGLLTPFSMRSGEYIWLWGLRYYDIRTKPFFEWIFKLQPLQFTLIIFINNLISFLFLLIISIGSISLSLKVKRREESKNFERNWLLLGIFFIAFIIAYLIEFEFLMRYYYKEELSLDASYWDFYYPGFAIIAPFLSSGIIMTGFILIKFLLNKKQTL